MDPGNAGINLTPGGEFRNSNNAAAAAGLGTFIGDVASGRSFEEASAHAGERAQEVADSWPSNSSKNSSSSPVSKPSEPSISEAVADLNKVNRDLEENERNRQDYTEAVKEADRQITVLKSRADELLKGINDGTTSNKSRDLGELRSILGANYEGGSVHGSREGEKWTNESGKEISGEYFKLLHDRNELAKLADIAVKKAGELEELAFSSEARLTNAFGSSLAHKLAGNSEVQAAYKIFTLRPRYRPTKEEVEAETKTQTTTNTLLDKPIYDEFGPTVRMIAESEGVDKKVINKLVSDVNTNILHGVFHLAKETAMLSAAGTVFRVAGLFAEAPMIVKALNVAGDFGMAPEIEGLAWVAGKLGNAGLSSELEVLAASAAKRALVAEVRIAQLSGGEQGVALLLEETTEALRSAKATFEKIADKSSPEGLAAYKKYKEAYELSKISKKESRPILQTFSKESKEALAEIQLAHKSLYDSARTTLETKAIQRGLESKKPLVKLIEESSVAPIAPPTQRISLGGTQQKRTFISQASQKELSLQLEYNEIRAKRISIGKEYGKLKSANAEKLKLKTLKTELDKLVQSEKKALHNFYEELDIRFNTSRENITNAIKNDLEKINKINKSLVEENFITNKNEIINQVKESGFFSGEEIKILDINDIKRFRNICLEKESKINAYQSLCNTIDTAIRAIRNNELNLETFFSKCKNLHGGIGGRSKINTFMRTFIGKKIGEHSLTVEEFTETIFNGMFRGHIPTYNEAIVLSHALNNSIIPLDATINAALNRLVTASKKIEEGVLYETRFIHAFESLEEVDKTKILQLVKNNTGGDKITQVLTIFHKNRENAAVKVLSELIEENKSLKSKYIDGFIEDQFKKWKGREGFNLENAIEEKVGKETFNKYKFRSENEQFDEARRAMQGSTIPQRSVLPSGMGSRAPIWQQRQAQLPLGSRGRGISDFARPSDRGFATVPTPSDVRYLISDVMELKEGPALRALVHPNLHEKLGLNKPGLRIPVMREIVFRQLCSEGKIRGAQAWELEVTRVRLAIAAKTTEKASPAKTAALEALRKKEAELITKHGNVTPGVKTSNNALSVQGDDIAAVDEQTVYSWGSKAPESKTAVQQVEDAAAKGGKGTTEKLLNKTNATRQQAEDARKASSIGDSKIQKDSEAVSASAASSANEVVLEHEALTAGRGLPSKMELPGSTSVQVSSATDEATSLYTRTFGKTNNPPLVSGSELEAFAAQNPTVARVVIDPSMNATSFIDVIKSYTPYGMSLRKLSEMLQIGAKNVKAFGVVARNLALEGRSIAAYNEFVESGLKIILEHASRSEVAKLITVFTPQRLIEFKSAMTTVFSYSHMHATQIINIMVTKIIPGSKYNEALIDGLIQIMRTNPPQALAEINKLAGQVIAQEIITGAAAAQAAAKGAGWFKMKNYYSLLLAGGGASVLFLANLANTPDLKTLAEKVSDTGDDLKRQLEQNPSYQKMQELSIQIRERILVDILGQVPPPPPPPMQPERQEWTDSLMRTLGYNPDKADDRRRFALMAETVRTTAAAAATAAAVAAATALAKAAVSATVGK